MSLYSQFSNAKKDNWEGTPGAQTQLDLWLTAMHGDKYWFPMTEIFKHSKSDYLKIRDISREPDSKKLVALVNKEAKPQFKFIAAEILDRLGNIIVDRMRVYFYENEVFAKSCGIKFAKRFLDSSAKSLGQTLDFVWFISHAQARDPNGRSMLSVDQCITLYSTIFANRGATMFAAAGQAVNFVIEKFTDIDMPSTNANVNIQSAKGSSPPGLHTDFSDSSSGREHTDQTHHFAPFFEFGYRYGTRPNLLKLALMQSGDIEVSEVAKITKITNLGDYRLGVVGWLAGREFKDKPYYAGSQIEIELVQSWEYWFDKNKDLLESWGFPR